jgi:hypothetical protein
MYFCVVISETYVEDTSYKRGVQGETGFAVCSWCKGKADVFANAIKHDHKSKNPTTRWSDIIKLK